MRKSSISVKISLYLLAVLVPFLVILIVIACAADERTDCYFLATGEIVDADLEHTGWFQTVQERKGTVISEPYLDPATGENIVSVAAPVFGEASFQMTGYFGFDVYLSSLSELLADISVGEEGYLELVSAASDYIYSNDLTAIGRNVSELDISEDYKNKVRGNYNGTVVFSYAGTKYTAIFQNLFPACWGNYRKEIWMWRQTDAGNAGGDRRYRGQLPKNQANNRND